MADRKQSNHSHEVKQQLLEKRVTIDLAGIEDEIKAWVGQQYKKITSAHEEHIKELRRLIETKAKIEREMVTITEELEAARRKSIGILQVVLDGRVDDYDEALKQLNGLTDGGGGAQVEVSQEL